MDGCLATSLRVSSSPARHVAHTRLGQTHVMLAAGNTICFQWQPLVLGMVIDRSRRWNLYETGLIMRITGWNLRDTDWTELTQATRQDGQGYLGTRTRDAGLFLV
jgi:hypothetical protein